MLTFFNNVRVYSGGRGGGGGYAGTRNFFDPKVTFGNRVLSMFWSFINRGGGSDERITEDSF